MYIKTRVARLAFLAKSFCINNFIFQPTRFCRMYIKTRVARLAFLAKFEKFGLFLASLA